jgi:hypothetical protein
MSSTRFGVVRYPTYYVVIDKADDKHKIVYESRSRDAAHRKAEKLNKEQANHG